MAKPEPKMKCPKCSSTEIALALDKSNKHYCQKCQNVWVPGLETAGRADLVLARAQKDVRELREALDAERKENLKLKAELRKIKGEPEPTEEEIFS